MKYNNGLYGQLTRIFAPFNIPCPLIGKMTHPLLIQYILKKFLYNSCHPFCYGNEESFRVQGKAERCWVKILRQSQDTWNKIPMRNSQMWRSDSTTSWNVKSYCLGRNVLICFNWKKILSWSFGRTISSKHWLMLWYCDKGPLLNRLLQLVPYLSSFGKP